MRPNILFITSDQQQYNAFGICKPEIKTPALDRIAKEGALLSRAYCANPTCTPSRASILTGTYPSVHGAWTLGTGLMDDQTIFSSILKEAGYRTALIGKAHFQPLNETEEFLSCESFAHLQEHDFWRSFGQYYGFDKALLHRGHGCDKLIGESYMLWLEKKGLANWKEYFLAPGGSYQKKQGATWTLPEEYHYSTWVGDECREYLKDAKEKNEPFFLWASFSDPHPPYSVPAPYDTMYDPNDIACPTYDISEHDKNPPHYKMAFDPEADYHDYNETGYCVHMRCHLRSERQHREDRAAYYGMISLMDKNIGRILDALDENGLTQNTLVIFTSDHGNFLGEHGLILKGPFHYEEMIRVPFLARWPGVIPEGLRSERIVSLTDLAPTFLNAAGVTIPKRMQGKNLMDLLTGNDIQVHKGVFCENHQEPTKIFLETYVTERYKITVYFNRPWGELFDLVEDPNEKNNLWEEDQTLRSRMLMEFISAKMALEPMPMPRLGTA